MSSPARLVVDHVELFVPDRYEAAAWYQRVLGLEILKEFEFWARDPKGPLMISPDGGVTKLALFTGPARQSPPDSGFHLLAFRVDASGFSACVRKLGELQVKDRSGRPVSRESVKDHQKAYSIYFADPYGNDLEITTYDYEAARDSLG
jgi:catechol 2,3-dioxygenase-like lactoylglutathione lyase family enzyme